LSRCNSSFLLGSLFLHYNRVAEDGSVFIQQLQHIVLVVVVVFVVVVVVVVVVIIVAL